MRVVILGINYLPEPIGIGPYTAGMASSLVDAGHQVHVICAKPYYPRWEISPEYFGFRMAKSVEAGVNVLRLPLYVPRRPTGKLRMLHHLSFAMIALPAMLAVAIRRQPHVIMAIAPSLLSAVVAQIVARIVGARFWLHIQDFEVDAAVATGLLSKRGLLFRIARRIEVIALRGDRLSAISPQMCSRLTERGVQASQIVELRNWAAFDDEPRGECQSDAAAYRQAWQLQDAHVALYSGNIANKQGLEIIVAAARELRHRRDLIFVICGEGPHRDQLIASASDLPNIQFRPLQPSQRLGELMALASVHLLPQIAEAADLLLPSKLTNMLASSRPVIATAKSGTGLALEIEGCGVVVPPGDHVAFASAIGTLLDDPVLRKLFGDRAGKRARDHWNSKAILSRFERQLRDLAA